MNYSKFNYQFPDATPRAEEDIYVRGDVSKQIQRIGLEVVEACNAYEEGQRDEAIHEVMDVIHAAETALRMMKVKNSLLSDVKARVITGNRERGYYL